MQAIRAMSKSRPLARVSQSSSPCMCKKRVNSSLLDGLSTGNLEFSYAHFLHRRFHSVVFFSGNFQRKSSHIELNNQNDFIRIPFSSTVMANRLFSSEAIRAENDSADAETVKGIYEKLLNCVTERRTAPPNAWLWSLIAKCSTSEDINLLFNILQKHRIFKLSNLRIADDFNPALCREVTKACVRAGAIDFGKKALWKHNLYGLTPDIGSAHHLLLHAKKHNDVKLMVEVMKLVKKNDLPLQPGTADLVFSICYSADKWDLISKYGKRFVKSGVRLRQASFDLWMEFAVKRGDIESLWKVENWRSEAMKQHSVSTAFSCAKGFLLDHKPDNAASIIQGLYQRLPDTRRPCSMVELQKLASEWPLDVIRHQKKKTERYFLYCVFSGKNTPTKKTKAFAAALQKNISALLDALPSLGVEANVTVHDFAGKEELVS